MNNFSFATFEELMATDEQYPPHTELSRQLDAAAQHARTGKGGTLKCLPLIGDGDVDCLVIPGGGSVELAFRDYPSASFTVEQINVVAMLLRLEHAVEREAGDPIALEGF